MIIEANYDPQYSIFLHLWSSIFNISPIMILNIQYFSIYDPQYSIFLHLWSSIFNISPFMILNIQYFSNYDPQYSIFLHSSFPKPLPANIKLRLWKIRDLPVQKCQPKTWTSKVFPGISGAALWIILQWNFFLDLNASGAFSNVKTWWKFLSI
jgi:hypothetical protein